MRRKRLIRQHEIPKNRRGEMIVRASLAITSIICRSVFARTALLAPVTARWQSTAQHHARRQGRQLSFIVGHGGIIQRHYHRAFSSRSREALVEPSRARAPVIFLTCSIVQSMLPTSPIILPADRHQKWLLLAFIRPYPPAPHTYWLPSGGGCPHCCGNVSLRHKKRTTR